MPARKNGRRSARGTLGQSDGLGDGLVPLASALGKHKDASRQLAFAKDRQWIGYGMNHLDLLSRRSVYTRIRRWLVAPRKSIKVK